MQSNKLKGRTSKFKSQFLLLCLVMTTSVVFSQTETPPSPFPGGEPDPLPINENAIIVLGFGLIFGSYMIYRYNTKQKNPV